VIIDFRGGGACDRNVHASDLYTAQAGLAPFWPRSTRTDRRISTATSRDFAGWTIVHIPYCRGEIHWGDWVQDYLSDLTVHHKGFVNARAVLDWVYARYAAPDTILVSGCSAGAYGAALHSAYIADHYTDARITLLADSGAGIITDAFLTASLPNWNAQANLPPFIDALQRPLAELSLPELYVAVGEHFPDMRLAQTAAQYDQDRSSTTRRWAAWRGLADALPRESRDDQRVVARQLPLHVPPILHCVTPTRSTTRARSAG
jgi:hypothetical protein